MSAGHDAADARLKSSFGHAAGYLPTADRIKHWVEGLQDRISRSPYRGARRTNASVAALQELFERNGVVRMYVEQMIDQVPSEHKVIKNKEQLLDLLDHVVRAAPTYNSDNDWHNFFPISSLFAFMMMTPAGEAVFRNPPFNGAIRAVLQDWCTFLDGEESRSVLNTGESGWLSPSAYAYGRLDEFVIPDRSAPFWGWPSFNAYFHREIKRELRPVDEPEDTSVIVSANDGTVYRMARNVAATDQFWAKGQPYSLTDMLDPRTAGQFVGGDVFQSFLGGADYHRWHSPVDGIICEARLVEGLMFSDVESAGPDPTAGTFSQSYAASVNTRALIFIECSNSAIGTVCVIAIGIAEISSVTITAKVGDKLAKGTEIGYFSYGGSSIALVFQPGAIDRFTVPYPSLPPVNPWEGYKLKVNSRIALGKRGGQP